MRTIVILMDTLNRRHLEIYGNKRVKTPNITRLASRSTVFNNHWTASAPCMPARHDILTGRIEFLERNWSAVQPYDCILPDMLRKNNIFSHMVTDHYHYFHTGGENYCTTFDSWDFIRGQEHDIYMSDIKKPESIDHYGRFSTQYQNNKETFKSGRDYPSPKTFDEATKWVERHHDDDNWLLYIDSFDPHEPFDCPDEYLEMYDDNYDGKHFNWPYYEKTDVEDIPEEALEHLRNRYAATLTMSDEWLGKLLDQLDKHNMWEDTAVILTTDHGFMLGEHGYLAKNYMPAYNELYNIPLVVHQPGQQEKTEVDLITQATDIFPTILELNGIDVETCDYPLHGRSVLPLMNGSQEPIHDYALYGVFGKQVNIFDGKYTYFRAAVREDNMPLSVLTAVPTTIFHYWSHKHIKDLSKIEMGSFLKWTPYPVYKFTADNLSMTDPSHRFDVRYDDISTHMLFDIENDYSQKNPIDDKEIEDRMCRLLVRAMEEHDSPDEQYERLGLVSYKE